MSGPRIGGDGSGGPGGRPPGAGGAVPGGAAAGGPGFGRPGGRPGGGHGMFGMGMGLPPAKSKDFRGSLKRLFGNLGPEIPKIAVVIVLAVISVFFAVIGPKILGNAINTIFEGAISQQLPAGVTQDQVIAAARASGNNQLADLLSSLHLTPGRGIDFGVLGGVLAALAGVYLVSSA